MEMSCAEFTMYHAEAALMRLENAMTMADVILGGGKAIAKAILERYGGEADTKRDDVLRQKIAEGRKAAEGLVRDVVRAQMETAWLTGRPKPFRRRIRRNPKISKEKAQALIDEFNAVGAKLEKEGKFPPKRER